jgi:hypothetical protein
MPPPTPTSDPPDPLPPPGEDDIADTARTTVQDTHITPPPELRTEDLTRPPSTWPSSQAGSAHFGPEDNLLLQFLPSGECITVTLARPLRLGRAVPPGDYDALDLSTYNARRRGVSRAHCQLERRGGHVVMIDLASTNGTFVNGEAVLPHKACRLAHGDRLVLGGLHIAIAFSTHFR